MVSVRDMTGVVWVRDEGKIRRMLEFHQTWPGGVFVAGWLPVLSLGLFSGRGPDDLSALLRRRASLLRNVIAAA